MGAFVRPARMHHLRRPRHAWLALFALALHLLLPLAHAGMAGSGAVALALCSSAGQQVQLIALEQGGQDATALVKGCPLCATHAAQPALPPAAKPCLAALTYRAPQATHPAACEVPTAPCRLPPNRGPPAA
ncbi:hypothetical protein N8I74_19015 [Chitiniphilus purpureus]|uniref:DUF2946 domain-containing protein n=1 Tax=Chitiniphilus purpureus TaxID=2981137 RepID=A0ABY6DLZ0_9NEIS|nr:DUF2946 family protein [Chitiniphilus sp. CD1]UXY15374.1 hypothetical protein N8I74_19015 [Chitiniphilus sp. CD1]